MIIPVKFISTFLLTLLVGVFPSHTTKTFVNSELKIVSKV